MYARHCCRGGVGKIGERGEGRWGGGGGGGGAMHNCHAILRRGINVGRISDLSILATPSIAPACDGIY